MKLKEKTLDEVKDTPENTKKTNCPECQELLYRRDYLPVHMQLKHGNNEKLKCSFDKCNLSFGQAKNFIPHYMNAHKTTREEAHKVAGINGRNLEKIPSPNKNTSNLPIKETDSTVLDNVECKTNGANAQKVENMDKILPNKNTLKPLDDQIQLPVQSKRESVRIRAKARKEITKIHGDKLDRNTSPNKNTSNPLKRENRKRGRKVKVVVKTDGKHLEGIWLSGRNTQNLLDDETELSVPNKNQST